MSAGQGCAEKSCTEQAFPRPGIRIRPFRFDDSTRNVFDSPAACTKVVQGSLKWNFELFSAGLQCTSVGESCRAGVVLFCGLLHLRAAQGCASPMPNPLAQSIAI
jgi:hypothetical protein